LWEQEFNWTAEYGKSDPTVMILHGAVLAGNPSLDPKVISVVLGKNNTVRWINGDDTSHGIVSDKGGDDFWGTGIILPGESTSIIFNQTGIFEYHGEPHPWISGKVIVLEE
jgi:plastocyanin